jgi:hypothetical protein
MEDEQSVLTPQQMEQTRQEYALNLANRIAASDRILNSRIF